MPKRQPLGICDHCLGPIPPRQWYTSRGRPRLYCSVECRNTANSRAGAPIRIDCNLAKSKKKLPTDVENELLVEIENRNIASGIPASMVIKLFGNRRSTKNRRH